MKHSIFTIGIILLVSLASSCQGFEDKMLEHQVKKSIITMFEVKGLLAPGEEVKDFKFKKRDGDKYQGILTLGNDKDSVNFNVNVDNSDDSLSWQIENMLKTN